VTDCEGMYDSEMNIAIEQMKAMYVHINRVQLPYFVVFCIILTQCKPDVSGLQQCDSGTCNIALVSPPVPCSIPGTGCLEL
jgi:hypothetical protein